MSFVVGMGLGGFHSRADRVRVFGRGKEDWTVVTEFVLVAPDKVKKEKPTPSLQPCKWLSPRTVNFMIAAVRTAFQPNSKHDNNTHCSLC